MKRDIWMHTQEEALSHIEVENKLSGEIAFFTLLVPRDR